MNIQFTEQIRMDGSKSDQHQLSPMKNNINAELKEQVMGINKITPKGKCFDLKTNSLNLVHKESVWISVERICMWILGRSHLGPN